MKKLSLFLLSLMVCLYIQAAEKYTAFIVKGEITVTVNGQSHPMKRGEVLDESAVIHVAQGAFLTLKSSDKKRHTLTMNKPYDGTIKHLKGIRGTKVKRNNYFMLMVHDKTSSDFIKDGHRTMSAGGYNTRDMFMDEQEVQALDDLETLFREADLID